MPTTISLLIAFPHQMTLPFRHSKYSDQYNITQIKAQVLFGPPGENFKLYGAPRLCFLLYSCRENRFGWFVLVCFVLFSWPIKDFRGTANQTY